MWRTFPLLTVAGSAPLWAQSDPRDEWAAGLAADYAAWGTTNLTYRIASNVELKLDLYAPQGLTAPNPTVINIHGGGWVEGTRESEILTLLP